MGLKKNLMNVLLVSNEEKSTLVKGLTENGFSIKDLEESNSIVFKTHEEMFENTSIGDTFYPIEEYLSSLQHIISDNQKNGFQIVGTIADRVINNGNTAKTINLEKNWNDYIGTTSTQINLLCPYKLPLEEQIIKDVLEIHN